VQIVLSKPINNYLIIEDSVKKVSSVDVSIDTTYNGFLWNVGYGFGGISALGVESEFRTHNFGVTAGVGLVGYSGGMRFYFKPKVSSSFIFVGWKNVAFSQGFSQISLDFGKRNHRKKFSSNFIFQIGLAVVMQSNTLLKIGDSEIKKGDILPSFGIGISW
jgi:hypothetical protein